MQKVSYPFEGSCIRYSNPVFPVGNSLSAHFKQSSKFRLGNTNIFARISNLLVQARVIHVVLTPGNIFIRMINLKVIRLKIDVKKRNIFCCQKLLTLGTNCKI